MFTQSCVWALPWHLTHWCRRNNKQLNVGWIGVCFGGITYLRSSWAIEFLFRCDVRDGYWNLSTYEHFYQWKHFQSGDAISSLKCVAALYLFWPLTCPGSVRLSKCRFICWLLMRGQVDLGWLMKVENAVYFFWKWDKKETLGAAIRKLLNVTFSRSKMSLICDTGFFYEFLIFLTNIQKWLFSFYLMILL